MKSHFSKMTDRHIRYIPFCCYCFLFLSWDFALYLSLFLYVLSPREINGLIGPSISSAWLVDNKETITRGISSRSTHDRFYFVDYYQMKTICRVHVGVEHSGC